MSLLLFVWGALTMLSFAPVGWYLLAPVSLLAFIHVCFSNRPRRAAMYGFWYGSGLFLTGTYWLYTSIHVFGQAPLWVAVIIMLCLVFIMGLYYAANGWLISRLAAGHVVSLLWIVPAVWVASEWLRGWFMSGFPWMTLGYGQIDSVLAGVAPVAGVYGVSLALLISATGLYVTFATRSMVRAAALTLFVAPWIVGAALQQLVWTGNSVETLNAAIVQGGISQDRKWQRDQFAPTLQLYRDSIAAHPNADLIVWPEVALPTTIGSIEPYLELLEEELAASGKTLLLGILERTEPETIYNSVLLLDGHSRQIYRKRHLVPFGEYFPVPDFIRNVMRMMSLPSSDLAAGDAVQPLLKTASGLNLAVAICYEDAYGAEQLYALPDAGLLINVSNDAWFGDSIAPHQHLEIARMRAVEAARFVVRSTNNGVSAFIDPRGQVIDSGPQFEYVAMSRDVTAFDGATPYARIGNWPIVVLCLAIIGAVSLRIYRR